MKKLFVLLFLVSILNIGQSFACMDTLELNKLSITNAGPYSAPMKAIKINLATVEEGIKIELKRPINALKEKLFFYRTITTEQESSDQETWNDRVTTISPITWKLMGVIEEGPNNK